MILELLYGPLDTIAEILVGVFEVVSVESIVSEMNKLVVHILKITAILFRGKSHETVLVEVSSRMCEDDYNLKRKY